MNVKEVISKILTTLYYTNYPNSENISGYSANVLSELLDIEPYEIRKLITAILSTEFFNSVTLYHPVIFSDEKNHLKEYKIPEDMYELDKLLTDCTIGTIIYDESFINNIIISIYSSVLSFSKNTDSSSFFFSLFENEYDKSIFNYLKSDEADDTQNNSLKIIYKRPNLADEFPKELLELWIKIDRAINLQSTILVRYLIRGTDKNPIRTILPLKLVFENHHCYLLGLSVNNKIKITPENFKSNLFSYRLDRMDQTFFNIGRKYELPDGINLDFINNIWGMDTKNLDDPIYVKVQFFDHFDVFKKVESDLEARKHNNPYFSLEQDGNGHLIYEDIIYGYFSFRSWIYKFGASAKVIEPKKLIDDIVTSARERLKMYK